MMRTSYEQDVQSRTVWHYVKGLLIRWWTNRKYEKARRIARSRGAVLGDHVILPFSLARQANSNLVVGDHVSIQSDRIDLRNPVHIGSNVIIGAGTEILTTSHNIDSPDFEQKDYGLTIEDYVWLPTKVLILPSCRKIGLGAVVGSGSVVAKDIEPMAVMSGNPAQKIKTRSCVHKNLVVESLLGGDYEAYRNSRK